VINIKIGEHNLIRICS